MLTVASFGGWGGGEMDKITKYAAGDWSTFIKLEK
jgi:hypothetical protein